MAFDWPDFVGQRFDLFYYSTMQTGGHADFDWFRVSSDLDATFTTQVSHVNFNVPRTATQSYTLGGRPVSAEEKATVRGMYIVREVKGGVAKTYKIAK